jgi:antitoxin component HigA of HigAB toxin-antitoxin module
MVPGTYVDSPEDEILAEVDGIETDPTATLDEDAACDARDALRQWIQERGLSQAVFAARMGETPPNLAQLLSGKRPLTYKKVERIAATIARIEREAA